MRLRDRRRRPAPADIVAAICSARATRSSGSRSPRTGPSSRRCSTKLATRRVRSRDANRRLDCDRRDRRRARRVRAAGDGHARRRRRRSRRRMAELPDEALASSTSTATRSQTGSRRCGGSGFPGGARSSRWRAGASRPDDGCRRRRSRRRTGAPSRSDVGAARARSRRRDRVRHLVRRSERARSEPLRGHAGARALAPLEQQLGVRLEDARRGMFEDEALLYVRPGPLIPEVTLVLEADERRAARPSTRLSRAAAVDGARRGRAGRRPRGDRGRARAPGRLRDRRRPLVVTTSERRSSEREDGGDRSSTTSATRTRSTRPARRRRGVFLYVDMDGRAPAARARRRPRRRVDVRESCSRTYAPVLSAIALERVARTAPPSAQTLVRPTSSR